MMKCAGEWERAPGWDPRYHLPKQGKGLKVWGKGGGEGKHKMQKTDS